MDITPEQLAVYRAYARQREQEKRADLLARHAKALALAHQASNILKEEFGVTRVRMFGSLLHPEYFHALSDIDLAVWDIQHYFRAYAALMDLDPEFDFDLVPIEDAKPSIVKVILDEGVDL
jgi:uncharacterized protein